MPPILCRSLPTTGNNKLGPIAKFGHARSVWQHVSLSVPLQHASTPKLPESHRPLWELLPLWLLEVLTPGGRGTAQVFWSSAVMSHHLGPLLLRLWLWHFILNIFSSHWLVSLSLQHNFRTESYLYLEMFNLELFVLYCTYYLRIIIILHRACIISMYVLCCEGFKWKFCLLSEKICRNSCFQSFFLASSSLDYGSYFGSHTQVLSW